MANVFDDYFLSSFLSSNPSSCSIEQCASKVPSWVNSEMKQALLSSFTKEEVKGVLFQMAPLKSLGPVGLVHVSISPIGMLLGKRYVLLSYLFSMILCLMITLIQLILS